MYITKFVDNTHYKGGSVMNYASYLEKERLIQERLDDVSSRQLSAYLDKQNDTVRVEGQEYFFNGEGQTFDSEQVTRAIDGNVKGLKKSEARYYTFAISPSREEIEHMRRIIADTKQAIQESGEVVSETFDDELLRGYLKEYAVKCMDAYARNFGHPKIQNNRDLLWFGMVEKDRYWKSSDKEIRFNSRLEKQIDNLRQKGADNSDAFKKIAGLEKRLIRECDVRPGGSREVLHAMMPKSGDNWHVHISVSRRDITNMFSLSPNAKGRGSKKHVLNGQSVRVGFDREAYKIGCEQLFDRTFVHHRLATESYEQAKRLRKEGTFVYAKQLAKDKATRREERLAFRQAGLVGYQDYFGDLLSCESLDGRQLMQLKGFLARQLHAAIPSKSVDEWMELDLEELRSELASFDIEPQHLSGSYITESVAARIGDKSLEVAGLQGGYRPVTVSYRLLRRGIAMRQATDRRREAVDRWIDIYSDKWYHENYRFESIGTMQRMDTLQAQAAFLNKELGESVLLTSAQEHAADLERQLVRDFLASHWADWKQETVASYARMLFGRDGAEVRTLNAFENMARERLLPVEAQKHIDTLAARCRVESLESLQKCIVEFQPQTASELTARLQTFMTERGETLRALKSVLADKSMPVFEKERQILRSALDDRDLYKSLSDLKRGILGVLERQCPDMRSDSLQKRLAELFKGFKEIRSEQKDRFDKAITAFLRTEVPDYRPLIEKQSQLERLIRELTPDAEKCSEQLIEARRAIERSLAPHTERIFVKKSQRLFGDSVQLKSEHAFLKFVEEKFTPEQAGRYKVVLPEIFARIEEQRRAIVQQYADRLLAGAEEVRADAIRLQQGFINRFIDRKYPARVAKEKKEALQRAASSVCRQPVLRDTEYKVLDWAVRNRIAVQAAAKVGPVKLPVSPQMAALKTAVKLFNVLTKGY